MLSAILLSATTSTALAAETLPLAGEWRFALDRADVGVKEAWFNRDLAERIQLPGVLQAQGYGDEISTNTPWVLSLYDKSWFQREDYQDYTQPGNVKVPFVCQPPRHYLGAAWYQRDIEIPTNWIGRRMELFLERTRWETRAWLDDRLLGTNNSLCVPHEFEAGVVGTEPNQIKPGKHRLTVRCDNRMLMAYRPDAHAVSDSLGSTWNGIVGKIELRSTPLVWIMRVLADADQTIGMVRLRVTIRNMTGKPVRAQWNARHYSPEIQSEGLPPHLTGTLSGGVAELMLPLNLNTNGFQKWDEFNPVVEKALVEINSEYGADSCIVSYGVRDFKAVGQEFFINGRPTHLRGTHHGGDFPLTGYPPCDVEYWLKLWRTCKEWGLNHVRFHSFCPPEAAFEAADQVGIYLQIEPGMWNEISPGTEMEIMLAAETERILKAYENHPSFVLMSASNEAKGRWKESLPRWVNYFRKRDPRRLYTPDTGWSLIDEPGPVEGADFLAVHRIGGNLMRGNRGWFGGDYSSATRGVNVPIVTHEVGQWCAYPDYDVIKKFTGYMRPGNFEIFRDSAERNLGVRRLGAAFEETPGGGNASERAKALEKRGQVRALQSKAQPTLKDFAYASGRFQLACYKEDIEANLRTPGLAGFQLLDLHDYVGQGTALVGVLDPFWESKSYVTAEEWRQFCSPVVPLARLGKRVFTTADKFEVPAELASYGGENVTNGGAMWMIRDRSGKVVQNGGWPERQYRTGARMDLGSISADISKLPAPAVYKLSIEFYTNLVWNSATTPFINSWNFWLYPAQVDSSVPTNFLLTSLWAEAEARLAAGGKVIFQPPQVNLDWSSPPLDKLPIFWNRLMGPGWSRMLGLWCDTNHPALAGFPTEVNCDWQWTEIIKTRAMNLDRLPRELSPIVSAIDDWNRNWKLGLIWEARVGRGRLLICTFDLGASSPVAKQLRRSLLDYAASDAFEPKVAVAAEVLRDTWFDTLVMRKLGATATADGGDAQAAIDGDPNTYWLTGAPARNVRPSPHPHELTVSFPQAVEMNGVVLMNRQNDRDHQGGIRGYTLSVSDDGNTWREIVRDELASTWNPQTIRFPNTVAGRQLKLTALSGYGSDSSTAVAELAVLYAGSTLPGSADTKLEYRRSRSTSTDIDEGDTTPAP